MAKPSGVKLVIKSMDDAVNAINSGVTDKYKLLAVVESIKDAERLCKECNINKLNLGGTKATAETRNISKAMNITPAEETILKGLCESGVDVTIQMVPEDSPVNVEKYYKRRNMLLQAILLGLVAMLGNAEYLFGTSLLSRPLVMGTLTGIVLGDVQTGVTLGATLELAFMGAFSIGASIPPEMISGTVLGTAFTITTGAGPETALTVGLPVASLVLIAKTLEWYSFYLHLFTKQINMQLKEIWLELRECTY